MTPLNQQLEDKKKEELRERLAELEHKQWSHWTKYMLDELYGLFDLDTLNRNCKPVQSLRRWQKQMKTEYKDLTEKEKDSDREWADKVLEKAIAEMKKQRQEILDKVKEGVGLNATILDDRDGSDMYLIREDEFNKILEQLNQPKTEQ